MDVCFPVSQGRSGADGARGAPGETGTKVGFFHIFFMGIRKLPQAPHCSRRESNITSSKPHRKKEKEKENKKKKKKRMMRKRMKMRMQPCN